MLDMIHHSLAYSSYEHREYLGASVVSEDLAHDWSWNTVKRFAKIVENHCQEFLLLSPLFLELYHGENHIAGSSVGSETTLTFREDVI